MPCATNLCIEQMPMTDFTCWLRNGGLHVTQAPPLVDIGGWQQWDPSKLGGGGLQIRVPSVRLCCFYNCRILFNRAL